MIAERGTNGLSLVIRFELHLLLDSIDVNGFLPHAHGFHIRYGRVLLALKYSINFFKRLPLGLHPVVPLHDQHCQQMFKEFTSSGRDSFADPGGYPKEKQD